MLTGRQTKLERGLSSAAAVLLLLTTAARSASLSDNLQMTASPAPTSASLTNSSSEEPLVLRSHTSCGSEHEQYCMNGGTCMYPQDNNTPFCICTSSYSGPRCLFYNQLTFSLHEPENVIAIIFGVFMLILFLAILIYCFACKRLMKSAPLIKSVPSNATV